MDQFPALVVLLPAMLNEGTSLASLQGWEDRETHYAAMSTVLRPDMLGVNVAPMVVINFLRYSRDSPV